MRNPGSIKQTGSGLSAKILVWGGVVMLIAGGLLTYPYINSRLATFPPTATLATSLQFSATPLPTATDVAPTLTPTHTHTPTPSSPFLPTPTYAHTPTPIPTLTSPPTPAPTPTPALFSPPTRIVIPSLGVDGSIIPISWQTVDVNGQQQAVWDVPDMDAAGWHETSAPLGVPGNTVINGHNTTHGEIFRDLYTMEAGDDIVLYAGETVRTFAVTEVLILPEAGQPLEVRLENARYILPTEDERLTIVTCHPYGSLQYRLIVIAQPVGNAN